MSGKAAVSLRGLRTFCFAAKHENFSAAAEALFITPSAVSHQIKNLEEELDQRLFERSARDLKLTGVGQAMYREIYPLIEQIDSIVGTFRTEALRSSVRMSIQPFFASEYFMPRLGEFTARHPEIDIQVSASDESAESRRADADLSIHLHQEAPAGVESQLLMPLRLVAAGSKELRKSLRVRDRKITSEFPIVIHESMPRAWKQWARATGIVIPPDSKKTRVDSMFAVVRAVEQGIGAALVPVPVGEQWFRQGTLVRLFDDEVVADLSYFLTWSSASAGDAGTVLLRDWILERFIQ